MKTKFEVIYGITDAEGVVSLTQRQYDNLIQKIGTNYLENLRLFRDKDRLPSYGRVGENKDVGIEILAEGRIKFGSDNCDSLTKVLVNLGLEL